MASDMATAGIASTGRAASTTVWSISDVCRMANMTSRTLRYYDQIGLLKPAGTHANGYRFYQRPQLLRLQQILLWRELGLGLDAVAAIVDGQQDQIAVLTEHRNWLLAESTRMLELARTVERTISDLEGNVPMTAEEMFNGFDASQYREEATQRWGKDAVERANESYRAITHQELHAHLDEAVAINLLLANLMRAGVPVTDSRVQEVVARHHRWVCLSWTPDAEAYVGLGELYVDDERFTAFYDGSALGSASGNAPSGTLHGRDLPSICVMRWRSMRGRRWHWRRDSGCRR